MSEISKPRSSRRWLVYCPSETGALTSSLFSPDRQYDLAINIWGRKKEDVDSNILELADRIFFRGQDGFDGIEGGKFRCFSYVYPELPRYDYYLLMDEDIETSFQDLHRLFLIGEKDGLDLFQASLTRDSYGSHPFLNFRKTSKEVRSSIFVEMMMPIFSARALEICLPTFRESRSGFGLDLVWPKLLNYRNIGIVDAVQCKHTRPVSSLSWQFQDGTNALSEMHALEVKYGVSMLRTHAAMGEGGYMGYAFRLIKGFAGNLWAKLRSSIKPSRKPA